MADMASFSPRLFLEEKFAITAISLKGERAQAEALGLGV
jgi:hypothetical protein